MLWLLLTKILELVAVKMVYRVENQKICKIVYFFQPDDRRPEFFYLLLKFCIGCSTRSWFYRILLLDSLKARLQKFNLTQRFS